MIKSVKAFVQGQLCFSSSTEKLIFPCCKGAIADPGREELMLDLWSSISKLAVLGRVTVALAEGSLEAQTQGRWREPQALC